jgi:hypothetical protein
MNVKAIVLTIQHQIVLGLDLLSELATGEFGEITLYGLNKLPGAGEHSNPLVDFFSSYVRIACCVFTLCWNFLTAFDWHEPLAAEMWHFLSSRYGGNHMRRV